MSRHVGKVALIGRVRNLELFIESPFGAFTLSATNQTNLFRSHFDWRKERGSVTLPCSFCERDPAIARDDLETDGVLNKKL